MTDNQSKTITISVDEYESLIDDSNLLSALIECGVDNWEGYEDALKLYHEQEE